MAELRRITTYPIKALDPFDWETGQITEGGVIEDDREYAILDRSADESYDPDTASVSGNGDYINGKRTAAVHRLRSTFDPEARTLTIRIHGETDMHTFDLDDRTELNAWLTDYFGRPVSVRRDTSGHHDLRKRDISGPSVISTATLREVASWFPEIETDSVRRRFRANLEIGGVPPFWEDRLVADHGEAVAFHIGDVRFEGVEPCKRCVVPLRDPDTGEKNDDFRQTFIEKRGETRPEWLDSDRFDSDFRLMTVTNIPTRDWGKTLRVGDSVEIIGTHSYSS